MIKIDLRAEERAIRRALRRAADKAKAAGFRNPEFFVEPEVPAIYVMDGDRDEVKNSHRYHAGQRQSAIVGEMTVPYAAIGIKLDVGAW